MAVPITACFPTRNFSRYVQMGGDFGADSPFCWREKTEILGKSKGPHQRHHLKIALTQGVRGRGRNCGGLAGTLAECACLVSRTENSFPRFYRLLEIRPSKLIPVGKKTGKYFWKIPKNTKRELKEKYLTGYN
ncbi:hypothetical protein CEXT_187701 [Caerostris extrusa]|uniref:Uncharacterized protein n=1 Tax=Caerostris extrusa TaxID=172846 RepID=A0AAV4TQG2_CAEEX|nr:hypothetical protein CEXT_187701 [Caerostris extrusa]